MTAATEEAMSGAGGEATTATVTEDAISGGGGGEVTTATEGAMSSAGGEVTTQEVMLIELLSEICILDVDVISENISGIGCMEEEATAETRLGVGGVHSAANIGLIQVTCNDDIAETV